MTLAGGDPDHLLEAYKIAYAHDCRFSFLDQESKLRVPLRTGDAVCIVGNSDWLPVLHEVVAEAGCSVVKVERMETTPWTIPPKGSYYPRPSAKQ